MPQMTSGKPGSAVDNSTPDYFQILERIAHVDQAPIMTLPMA
jgi:hypothetical protein